MRDDLAYILPMMVFLLLVGAGGHWPNLYPHFYVARALIVPILLIICWKSYTKIRWNGWLLGAFLGVITTVQWIGMQLLLQKIAFHYHDGLGHPQIYQPFAPSADAFNPTKHFLRRRSCGPGL